MVSFAAPVAVGVGVLVGSPLVHGFQAAWHPLSAVRTAHSRRPLSSLQLTPTPVDAVTDKLALPFPTARTDKRRTALTPLSSAIPMQEEDGEQASLTDDNPSFPQDVRLWADEMLNTYWGPRILLIVLAAVYATNFPLGALMNDHLPASAATASRMFVAGVALAPFIPQLKPELRVPAVLCGCFTALGYVSQSLALMDVDPARVSFLGSVTVLWCPLLEAVVDKKPMGFRDAPQTWLAAALCLAGIGVLELSEASLAISATWGDALALLQAVGFGTGVFWTSRMLRQDATQALPVTATLVATTAFLSMLWCGADGWATATDSFQFTLPGMAMEESLRPVLYAVLWTGLISTSLNFYIELMALGKVPPSEASVLLASEPLWAALFAAAFYGSTLSVSDGVGGLLIVGACLVNALVKPSMFQHQEE
jgi:drug/metabolite transporter (DMT)-like permease